MVTPRQLIRGIRKDKPTPKGFGSPQKKARVNKTYTMNPKKPNSARRAVAKVVLRDGREITVFIPGEKHNLKEYSNVLIVGGGAQDLPGVDAQVIPGALDSPGIIEGRQHARSTSRSKYGTPKPKK
ncbi:MAG: 30S ribosomal protein S12 [Candidatus Moeniiplasma glomeromycotorum]|nr:30S ribosomal protein S12 [Candidatus Moeniiplasma glomeromycotorum]MCE8167011.1 30S ribosomal protein S12 [Candidatus Moeniiplasma glomeromycotorum]MCE8168977.1 30S ribosomal protein S12 [Candidatus Moeniiplasma glomeromycotorum]